MARTAKPIAELLKAREALDRQIAQRRAEDRARETRARRTRYLALGQLVAEAGFADADLATLRHMLSIVGGMLQDPARVQEWLAAAEKEEQV